MISEGIGPSEVLSWLCAIYWAIAVCLLFLSVAATALQPFICARRAKNAARPPVSVVLPIKLFGSDFDRSQDSALTQDYPISEVLASTPQIESEAAQHMRAIFARHPETQTRLIHSTAKFAQSPKVDNLFAPFSQAENDVIFMKDANVVLQTDDLSEHVRQLVDGVGLVCAIQYGAEPENFAAHIEASILNGPHSRMLYLASCFGHGFGVGKIMLFRRSDFLRAGGFEAIAHTVGEDNAMAKALARIGLKTVFSHRLARQELGRRELRDVFNRQLRWSVIRRVDEWFSFFLEPFCQAIPALFAAYAAAPLAGVAPSTAVGFTILLWLILETLLSFYKGWPVSWLAPAILLCREVLMLAVWLRASTTDHVIWAGQDLDVVSTAEGAAGLDAPLATRKKG